MKLQVYDSLTRKKQPLLVEGSDEPLRIYFCGPTVYQRIHIGNARTFVTFMSFTRYLRHLGFDVLCVSNITDINDKIYNSARAQGIASDELARQATRWYVEDTDRLGLGRPDVEPLATESIGEIVALIQDIVDRDLAYESRGDVYFRVARFGAYGKLSNQQVEQLQEGAGSGDDEGPDKEAALDFALWKATKPDEDTSWDSPWGKGRPGWHIECSAMAEKHLGPGFDVHGGGLDLIFPHHENEIAQSSGAGRLFARLWMHGGMLEVGGGEKMSKSEGNIETLHEVLERWPAWAIILFFFGGSYRNPLEYSHDAMDETVAKGQRITEALRRSERYLGSVETRHAGDPGHASSVRGWEGIHEALQDDFNTAIALSELFGLVYDLNTAVNEHATPQIVRDVRATILEFLDVFALGDLVPQPVDLSEEIKDLLEQRERARATKQFEEADRIRAQLHEMGYVVRDTSDGVDVVPVGDAGGDGSESDAA